MNSKEHTETFCCPDVVPPGTPDDFCIPECDCPERILTPLYPSPTSCLSEEETLELDEKIETANRLLLDLALSGEQSEESRRSAFDRLVGHFVKIELNEAIEDKECKVRDGKKHVKKRRIKVKKKSETEGIYHQGKVGRRRRQQVKEKQLQHKKIGKSMAGNKHVEGRVNLVGFDFVTLLQDHREFIIPFGNICKISSTHHPMEMPHERELESIDPCLRRELTFNFGRTVSASPELIQIFYRLRLNIYLLMLVGKKMKIAYDDRYASGTLHDVTNDDVSFCLDDKRVKEIPLRSIRLVVL
ncbi:hypothetical protein DS745_06850 [Anaerobacillus alkaliphilus]|uniref:Uncharacterized protein n=1 Tax=Anaerobacillus alkaliphilus TaxID=1548597 RepID=A0A4Q0VUK6_9BACI|nr:hypothetical protein [Anaerobacillus alkaliphilus]RXJ02416.1 hypothetical protein DS745_06850 [Anaerobacillus alkaliphilus]